jgi:alpha-beta hydrolase superfamily lysophospholipase
MKFEEGYLNTPDGIRLHFGFSRAKSPRAWVVLCHGFGEYFERYEHVATFLNGLNLSVLGFDFRGFGRSEGSRGAIDRYDDYADDLASVLEYLKVHEGVEKPHLMGHSQGGLSVLYFLRKSGYRPSSAILSAPALAFAVEVPPWKRLAGQVASLLYPTLALPAGVDPYVLTHDRAVCHAYESSPLVVRDATARWYTECLRAQQELKAAPLKLDFPVLFLQGDQDKLVSPPVNRAFFDVIQAPRKEWKEYPGFYHEVFNEVDKERPINDVRAWLESL